MKFAAFAIIALAIPTIIVPAASASCSLLLVCASPSIGYAFCFGCFAYEGSGGASGPGLVVGTDFLTGASSVNCSGTGSCTTPTTTDGLHYSTRTCHVDEMDANSLPGGTWSDSVSLDC